MIQPPRAHPSEPSLPCDGPALAELPPLPDLAWLTSSHSGSDNACVAVAVDPDGEVVVHNTNRRHLGVLPFTPAEWSAFVAGVKDGEFDGIVPLN
jgi:hypothetical protein